MQDRESWLIKTVIELAGTDAGVTGEEQYARIFATRLADFLSPAEVGLLLRESGQPATATGSSTRAAALTRLEAGDTPGPCAECCRTGCAVCRESFTAQRTRWPAFATAAGKAGFRTVVALPLRHNDETVGAVSLLSPRDHIIAAADVALVQTLAEAAAVAIAQRRALRLSIQTTQQLRHALDSRVIIEQAKGALSARLGITPEEAFGLLRRYARSRSRPLADVAAEVVASRLHADDVTAAGKR